MYRNIIEKLKAWKNSEFRKPLILAGARQVGKTYILKEFGKAEYSNVAYVNCDKEAMAKTLFVEDYDIKRIVMAIAAITGQTIVPGKTLIILDEIQEVKRGLSVLKYFCEDAPEYHVAVAGSLLGITMRQGESVPVGKVDVLHMYPMTYDEFLFVASRRNSVFYYSSGNKLELDFLIQHGTEIVPIEAKAEENLRSKSLASFVSSHPGMHGIRFSMSDYREQEWMTNILLYAVSVYF